MFNYFFLGWGLILLFLRIMIFDLSAFGAFARDILFVKFRLTSSETLFRIDSFSSFLRRSSFYVRKFFWIIVETNASCLMSFKKLPRIIRYCIAATWFCLLYGSMISGILKTPLLKVFSNPIELIDLTKFVTLDDFLSRSFLLWLFFQIWPSLWISWLSLSPY